MKSLCDWFTGGKRIAVGGCLIVLAALVIFLSKGEGTMAYTGYLMFVVGIGCMWNSLLSKINACNVNLFLYALLVLIPTCVGMGMVEYVEGSILIGVIAICVVVIWLGSTLLIQTDNVFKRIIMGLLSTMMNALTIAVGLAAIAIFTMPE